MRSSRVSEIAALGFKVLESGKRIAPRAYQTVGSAEIVDLPCALRNLRKRFYDYGSKEMPLMRNWRLYWRSYQKSREKAPLGALVLCTYGNLSCNKITSSARPAT